MGADYRERDIIRQQIEWTHSYVMGIESRIYVDKSRHAQEKIKSIVRSFDVDPKFRSKEFEGQIDKWVEEIIRKLVVIREVYK